MEITFILIIYLISVIGAALTVRYDSYFNEDSLIVLIVFCPLVNSIVSIIELFAIINLELLNKKLYKLITYKRK